MKIPEEREHLLSGDEPVAIEVVDCEGEGRPLLERALQEHGGPGQPLVLLHEAVRGGVEHAEDPVHQDLFSAHAEGTVQEVPENDAFDPSLLLKRK